MKFFYTTLLAIFLTTGLWGQILEPVAWETSYEQIDETTYDLIFTAEIDDGWVLYSHFIEEGGPIPTTFYFDEADHFAAEGELVESQEHRKEGMDPVFQMKVAKFSEKAVFTQRIKVTDTSKPIAGYIEYMSCDDEKCIPLEEEFSFTLETESETPTTIVLNEVSEGDAGQPDGPVSWSFSSEKLSDDEYALHMTAQVEEGWYIYSQDNDGSGPVPTTFEFTPGDHFATVGPVEEKSKRKEGKDPLFDNINVVKLTSREVDFVQKVKVKNPAIPIEGSLNFMTCDDTQCLPPTWVDFKFDLAEGSAGLDAAATAGLPTIDQSVPGIRETYTTPAGDCGEEDVARDSGLLWTFILGFAGGLLALLTPCVFPMIPLTVSFFTKSSSDRKKGLRNAILYGVSIIVIYVAVGLLITGVFGAAALNALSTNWIANVLFFLIFLFFAFSFFGYYELTLPSSWSNQSDKLADKGGMIGIFFMAFTLALVSFSCTGPIIGSAIVQAATDAMGPFVVMLGFSTALALPFTLFAAFPGWLSSLPRSGSWMNSVKVVLGFLELALALKFLSVADMTMHWNILPYEVFMGLWILIFAATTLYLLGLIRFPHDSPVKKLSPTRMGFAALFGAFTVYLLTGFAFNDRTQSYDSKLLLSGLAPPAHYNLLLPEPSLDQEIKAKYPSFSKCANNLDCFKDYEEGLSYAREVNKPVLLDFSGYGCVNCRKTEEHIWIEDRVWEKLSEDFVLVSLIVDDRQPLEEIKVSEHTGSKLRNVGNLWADFQIVNFEQNSQPLYVMMSPDEQVLAAPRGYKEGVDDYADFLECGLRTFERLGRKE